MIMHVPIRTDCVTILFPPGADPGFFAGRGPPL
jgi:hypothetical protein